MTPEIEDGTLVLRSEVNGCEAVLQPAGDLDANTCHLVQAASDQVIERGVTRLIVDGSEMRFMDSSGIHLLLTLQRRLAPVGGTVSVVNPTAPVARVLQVAGLDRWLVAPATRPA